MKHLTRIGISLLLVGIIVLSSLGFVAAQEDMMTHTCDATLILLLYIAENDYGYHPDMIDLSTYEKGQYTAMFDEMMAMMDETMTDETMTDETMTDETMTDETMTDENMSDDQMMGDMVTLEVGNIEGEDMACTDLRADLQAFFDHALMSDMSMDDSGN